jgi:hypothetical protein
MRIEMRHIEPGGVGYRPGYTTMEAFLDFQDPWNTSILPFFDLRVHLFNNVRVAGNVGLGIRAVSSRIWGVYAYYDYHLTLHQGYSQASVGFESLGEVWDVRVNGYLPLGAKKSSHFGGKREFALKSANGEVGAKYSFVYAALGPYYLDGYYGKISWGGKVRLAISFGPRVQVEASGSYDKLFQWVGQGQIGLSFPFGSRKNLKPKEIPLQKRAMSSVGRNEIIPIFH